MTSDFMRGLLPVLKAKIDAAIEKEKPAKIAQK
jgi:hypothetical protein